MLTDFLAVKQMLNLNGYYLPLEFFFFLVAFM